jgi:hypothetical protein
VCSSDLARHRRLSGQLSPGWPLAVAAACRQGLALLAQRHSTHAELGLPWSADVVDELQKGLSLLDQVAQARQQLSVTYSDQVDQLNTAQLQREWAKAEKAIWPVSAMGMRKIRAVLDAVITGEGEPNVAGDLRALARLRGLRAEVELLELGPSTEGVWAGVKTRREFADAALRFQHVLAAARAGQPWDDAGLEAVANGRCGDRLARELARVRTLKSLDAQIAELAQLGPATGGLWSGLSTRSEVLEAALVFQTAVDAVRASGPLAGEHLRVASGECGAALAADLQVLHQRTVVEQELASFNELAAATAGLWRGLETPLDEIEQALKFQTSMVAAVANLATTPEGLAAVKAPLERLIGEGNALLQPGGPVEIGRAHV